MKALKFSFVLRTRENTDVFSSLAENIFGIHSKRVNILYIYPPGLINCILKGQGLLARSRRYGDVVNNMM